MRHALLLVLTLLLLPFSVAAQPPTDRPFRAIWVTRWDYRTAADIDRIMEEVATLGVTDVIWQIRGQADAFYKSDLEPWGRELFRDLPKDATDPGYDPLERAVEQAHARKLKIHAWVNVMPMWKGTTPPDAPNHLFHTQPLWRLYDAKGIPQALHDHYIIVNPIYPEVQDHIVKVCADIVRRYNVDGLHLDYIRFVSDTMKDPAAYPADERSIGLFKKATGAASAEGADGVKAYRAFIRQRITDLVRRLKKEAVQLRPGAVLTAAVWRRPELGRDTFLQDGASWLNEGTLDIAMPMIYQAKNDAYVSDLEAWVAAVDKDRLPRLVPGLANYQHTPEQTAQQVDLSRNRGVTNYAIFAYASLFESVDPNQSKAAAEVKLRDERRRAMTAFMRK